MTHLKPRQGELHETALVSLAASSDTAAMGDHTEFLARLPAADKAVLSETNNRTGITHLAGHGGLIVIFGLLIGLKIPFWPILLPVQGILINFLFTLEHECTHRTPFRDAWLNDWVGRVAGFLILLPFEWFRYFHLAHHRFTNLPGRDPELDAPKPETLQDWITHVSGAHVWAGNLALLIRLVRGRESAPYLPQRALPRMEREARVMLVLYIGVGVSLFWTSVLFWVWLLPAILGQPFLRLYLLAEHGDCPALANMFENTRTTFTNRIVRFFAWNMPYHTEHHVFPAVPFHQLPALHERMRQDLRVTADGYLAFTREFLARRR